MDKTEKEIQAGKHIRGMAAHILEEVIKADMSMHYAQIVMWKKFGELRPVGVNINPDIHLGFAEERYLCLNEVKLDFHIRPVSASILNRIRTSFKNLFRSGSSTVQGQHIFDICSASDENAMAMSIVVKRFENGTIKAEYKPADQATDELMKEEIGNR
jgi:hypothetical protein